METISDPKNYRLLSEPFESSEAANEAVKGFCEETRALRQKYKLADVHVIVRVGVLYPDGEEGEANASFHFGNVSLGEAMCAIELGRQTELHNQAINILKNASKA